MEQGAERSPVDVRHDATDRMAALFLLVEVATDEGFGSEARVRMLDLAVETATELERLMDRLDGAHVAP